VNFREKEKQVLDQILGPGRYDARIRPSGANGTGEENTHTHTHTLYESVQVEQLQTTVPRYLFWGQV
jgi:anionic glutamate receptor